MLAYVFWHWPRPTEDTAQYVAHLGAFHASLRDSPPAGFLASAAFELAALPWQAPTTPPTPPYFADWYLVEGFAALEALNDAAVSASRLPLHNTVAYASAGGAGGLYRLRAGTPDLSGVGVTSWFAKPAGMSYDALYAQLDPFVREHGGALWRRQMVLGPAPEFCWWAPGAVALPEGIPGQSIPLNRVFP